MDTGSYEFDALFKKYDGFTSPAFTIKIGGKELDQTKVIVSNLEIEMSATGAAGGCSFTVGTEYDFQGRKWVNVISDKLEVGATLEIQGGYVKQKLLFYGYVDDYNMMFPKGRAPKIAVSGLDGLGYLMSFQEPIFGQQQKPKDVVTEILQKSKSAGYAKDFEVGSMDGFETPVIKKGVDDWKFLNTLAERYGLTLASVCGELVFKDLATNTSPIVTLSMSESLLSFEKKLSMAHQVGKVEIWGKDVNSKFLKGMATSVSIGGDGKTATQLAPKFAKAALREYTEFARTQAECDLMAQGRLNSIAMNLVSGRGSCIGIPEMIAGRYVKIIGADQKLNGTYFLSKVKHIFSPEHYVTEFEIKGARS